MLAAKWLAAGFDSPQLRQLAAFRAGDGAALMHVLDLMPEALRSIGFDPAPADAEFTARCQRALNVVQHDLDITGYSQYRMRALIGRGWPATVFPTLPDGSYWSGSQGMSRELDGPLLLFSAAGSVSATLKEVHEIEWPVCAVHGGHSENIWDGEDPVDLISDVAWWLCTTAGHALAPVGQLTARLAQTP